MAMHITATPPTTPPAIAPTGAPSLPWFWASSEAGRPKSELEEDGGELPVADDLVEGRLVVGEELGGVSDWLEGRGAFDVGPSVEDDEELLDPPGF